MLFSHSLSSSSSSSSFRPHIKFMLLLAIFLRIVYSHKEWKKKSPIYHQGDGICMLRTYSGGNMNESILIMNKRAGWWRASDKKKQQLTFNHLLSLPLYILYVTYQVCQCILPFHTFFFHFIIFFLFWKLVLQGISLPVSRSSSQ